MSEIQKCVKCGTSLRSGALEGLCPACMVIILRETPTIALPQEGPGDRIRQYKLLQKIGEGGCGVVYMAEQEEPVRRRVALKVIKLGVETAQVIARFEAERQALALMDHPNIARVFDAGATDAGRPFFVMELVRGIKITDFCAQNNLSPKERLDLFIQVCQAIQHAHQKGIIHRDIKPSNVLVTQQDNVAMPKVIDFGIAKATADQRLTDKTLFTAFEQFIGTPAYMSPEQAEMGVLDIDTRSDIYSLGVLLYELLTGKTPFDVKELQASGFDAMRKIIREKEPPRPSARLGQNRLAGNLGSKSQIKNLKSHIHSDLDWIVMKSLEKDRTRRYDTANGLAMDLTRHLKNEPVVARPPSTAYRLQKAFRRNRLGFSAAAAIAASLIVGFAVSRWQAVEARRARQGTEKARLAEQAQRVAAERASDKATIARKLAEYLLYVANMNRTQAAWEQGEVSRMRELLAETATSPERGFEWYYWQRRMHLELNALRGHGGPILALAYSPDGRRILTGSEDHTAKVWDADTGKELFPLEGHTAPVRSVAFSTNGQLIVTGSWDKTAKVWDSVNGTSLVSLKGHKAAIFSVAFSPDGKRIVTGSQDQTVRIWDVAGGSEVQILRGHSNYVWAVAFSPDGRRVVSGGWDQTAKVWDAATGGQILTLKGHHGAVFAVAFSPDGRRILTGGQDHKVMLWDAATGNKLHTLRGHRAAVFSADFSRDGTRIISSSEDQTARLWSAVDGEELRVFNGHGSRIGSVALSPDSDRIVTGGGAVLFSPDGTFFGTGAGDDDTAKVWDAAGETDALTLKGHASYVVSVEFSPDGKRIVSGGFDGMARVWDVRTGKEIAQIRAGGTQIYATFSPDGLRVATGSDDGTAKVWDLASGKELLRLTGHTARVFCVAFTSDGRSIATGGWDRTVRLWNAVTGGIVHTLTHEGGAVYSVAFSPDGQRLISASGDGPGIVTVWATSSGKALFSLQRPEKIWSAAFSRDGRRIVAGSLGLAARVWDADTGDEQLILKGHTAHVQTARFSPDGRRIVTGSFDQTAKLWDAVTGKELLSFKGHGDRIYAVAFSQDGQAIATGSGDKTIKVWQAAKREEVASWEKEEQELADKRAALKSERVAAAKRDRDLRNQDPGIKPWLVLSPISYEGDNGKIALDQEQIPQEADLRPRVGERVLVGREERIWSAVEPKNHLIDFNQLAGKETASSVAYAICYIVSEMDQPRLVMRVGSDDQAKIFLNGREIYRHTEAIGWEIDRDQVPQVELKAGLNVLVFKVVNQTGGWRGSVRFTDSAGQLVRGLRITLDPDLRN